jgi:hypothetical protein
LQRQDVSGLGMKYFALVGGIVSYSYKIPNIVEIYKLIYIRRRAWSA